VCVQIPCVYIPCPASAVTMQNKGILDRKAMCRHRRGEVFVKGVHVITNFRNYAKARTNDVDVHVQ
jgi:hypothetical protein